MWRLLGFVSLLVLSACASSRSTDEDVRDDGSLGASSQSYALTAAARDAWITFTTARDVPAPSPGQVVVVGVRGLSADGERHPTVAKHEFDDIFVVLESDRARVLSASTHPFEKTGVPGVPDVNRDGAPDVGMVRAGVYRATLETKVYDGAPVFRVKTPGGSQKLAAFRDTDHDGVISTREREASTAAKHTIDGILFHVGSSTAPKAVGCQVTDRTNMTTLGALVGNAFHYVLVEAEGETLPPLDRAQD